MPKGSAVIQSSQPTPSAQQGLGATIRQRRRDLLLTQADAADLAGVSERFVREVEAGKETVRLDKLRLLLAALGLELVAQVRRT